MVERLEKEDIETRLYSRAPSGYRRLFTKGPHGLGDPYDRSLNDLEWNAAIPAQQRDIIVREHCSKINQEYEACRQEHGFVKEFFKCSSLKNQWKECINCWINDDSIRERAINEYLDEREAFRLTGLTKWERDHPEIMEERRKKRWIRSKPPDAPSESLKEAYMRSWNEFREQYSKPKPESKEDS